MLYYQEMFPLDQAFAHTLKEIEMMFQVDFELAEEIPLLEIK